MVAKTLSIFAVTAWFASGALVSAELMHFFIGVAYDSTSVLAVVAIAGFCGLVVDSLRFLSAHADASGVRRLPALRSVIARHILDREAH